MVSELGIPYRDLRVLDSSVRLPSPCSLFLPMSGILQFRKSKRTLKAFLDDQVPLTSPTSIFIREKALVVNVESIKMLVCKDQVFVLSVPTPGDFQHGMFPTLDSRFVHFLAEHLCSDGDSSR